MTPLVHLREVAYRYPDGTPALEAVAFTLAAGERVALLGPTGAGKSTLLQLLGGVVLAQAGDVQLLGQSWAAMSPAQRDMRRADHIGFVFQQFNLVPYLSALDNVLLPCRFSGRRREVAEHSGALVDEALRLLSALGLGAADVRERNAARLSVGQQQRVAAARALIGRPALMLADEPTSALDADNRAAFLDLLFAEARSADTAIILVSHDASLRPHFDRHLVLKGAASS